MNQQMQRREVALERRQQIAALRLAGLRDHGQLAERFNVTRRMIDYDFKVIDGWWQERAAEDIAKDKGQDAERIEELIAAIWDQALDKANKSQTFFIDRVIALLDRRAKLLGLDAPQKLDKDLAAYARAYAREHGGDEALAIETVEELLREARVRG